jgi:Xaa-Pro aminopeptidase
MARVLEAHGISSFPHGHGMGLEPRDYPIIVPDSGLRVRDDCVDEPADLPIEAGMVLNFEAGIFMPGVASLHTEESVLVTEHGCEALIPHDRSFPVVPGRLHAEA